MHIELKTRMRRKKIRIRVEINAVEKWSQASWWYMLVIPASGKRRQEGYEFDLGYTVRLCLKCLPEWLLESYLFVPH